MANLPNIGFSASLIALREELQGRYSMLQIWGGDVVDGDDFLLFVSNDLKRYVIISNSGAAETGVFSVILAGNINFVHEKNLNKLLKLK